MPEHTITCIAADADHAFQTKFEQPLACLIGSKKLQVKKELHQSELFRTHKDSHSY